MRRCILMLTLLVGFLGVVQAGEEKAGLQAGDVAPPFSLPGSDGEVHSLSGLKGKTVVIAWFPKAFTGG